MNTNLEDSSGTEGIETKAPCVLHIREEEIFLTLNLDRTEEEKFDTEIYLTFNL